MINTKMINPIQRKRFVAARGVCESISQLISSSFGVCSIEELHTVIKCETFNRSTDQASSLHKVIYSEFDKSVNKSEILRKYYLLCAEWLNDLTTMYSCTDWAIQRYPSVRAQFPENISVFEFHRDSDYCHPLGEINHFLAITEAKETATLYVEHTLGWSDFRPLNLDSGESAILNTSVFKHGDYTNKEGYTRLSIDFRAIPVHVLESGGFASPRISLTKKKLFDTSDYYLNSNKLKELLND